VLGVAARRRAHLQQLVAVAARLRLVVLHDHSLQALQVFVQACVVARASCVCGVCACECCVPLWCECECCCQAPRRGRCAAASGVLGACRTGGRLRRASRGLRGASCGAAACGLHEGTVACIRAQLCGAAGSGAAPHTHTTAAAAAASARPPRVHTPRTSRLLQECGGHPGWPSARNQPLPGS
jgi:hypothetical protein